MGIGGHSLAPDNIFGDRITVTPEGGFGFSATQRDYRLCWRLTRAGAGLAGAVDGGAPARGRQPRLGGRGRHRARASAASRCGFLPSFRPASRRSAHHGFSRRPARNCRRNRWRCPPPPFCPAASPAAARSWPCVWFGQQHDPSNLPEINGYRVDRRQGGGRALNIRCVKIMSRCNNVM